jgi:hypothetical protein
MLRDLFIPVYEALFWFTGGELLVNTFWLLPWVFGGTILMVAPLFLIISKVKSSTALAYVISIIWFFPMLMLIVSVGAIQHTLIEECRMVSAEVTIEGVAETQNIRQCRHKENFYDTEYGPWRQVTR